MRARAVGAGAALLWVLLCLRWFDAGAPWRPAWLGAVPPIALAVACLVLAMGWIGQESGRHRGTEARRDDENRNNNGTSDSNSGLWLVVGLAVLFRLPLVWQASVGYLTSDGALSGIVALHVRDGADHLVFVPHVPYSGSLKSHLTALLALGLDPSRAFALVSVLFYGAFVAGVYRLGQRIEQEVAPAASGAVAAIAGLYLAFAPPFVTHYSLSNDGNYVEVLALGTWALVLAAGWLSDGEPSPRAPLGIGLLLGLAFWCHILAVIHVAAIGLAFLAFAPRRVVGALPGLASGFALGDLPGLLWNAGNGWESLHYILPGGRPVGALEEGPSLGGRALAVATGHWPVLLGYDSGYGPTIDAAFRLLAGGAVVLALWAVGQALRDATVAARPTLRLLLVFTVVNGAIAVFALPAIPGNPRYLLFLMAALPLFLARTFGRGGRRWLLAGLIAWGALASLAQGLGAARADAQWRAFVAALESESVRHCYTDFYLATKIDFLSEERIVCSAKLGPTTTEYFYEYRDQVERAPAAALIAVNPTAAEKLERRLDRLGVGYERRDWMKPVLLGLSRKVDPAELFPGREFPLR